jgi:hypothetical protein
MADDKRPEGLETKDTRGTLLGYIPAEVPHVSRTAHELSDDERANAERSAGTPHAGAFNDEVAAVTLGQPSDSEHARRVGEGHYPAEAPAAPAQGRGASGGGGSATDSATSPRRGASTSSTPAKS